MCFYTRCLLVLFVWSALLPALRGQIADEFAEAHLLDIASTPVSAGLRYADHEAAGEGYVVLFRGGQQDVVYYYDGKEEFRPIFTGREDYQLGFHRRVGGALLMTECSPAGDTHRPYSLDLGSLRTVRLPEAFGNIYRYTRRGDDHLLADSTLVLWDEGGIYASRPPYDVAPPVLVPEDSLGETVLYRSVAARAQVLIVAGSQAYLTDGSRVGTKGIGPVYLAESPTLVEAGDQVCLFNDYGGFNAIDLREPTTHWWAYPERHRLSAARTAPGGDSIFYYLYDDWTYDNHRIFTVGGLPLDTTELAAALPGAYVDLNPNDLVFGKFHLVFPAKSRRVDTTYLYYTNLDLSEPRALLADHNGGLFNRNYFVDATAAISCGERTLVLATEGTQSRHTSHLFILENGQPDTLPGPVLSFKGYSFLNHEYTLESGEGVVFSVRDSYTNPNKSLYLWKCGSQEEPIHLKDIPFPSREATYLEANGQLYLYAYSRLIPLYSPDEQPGPITSFPSHQGGWLAFADRLVVFGRGYAQGQYAYDSDYRRSFLFADNSTALEPNIFGRTASTSQTHLQVYGGTVFARPDLGSGDGILAIADRGRRINSENYRNTIQYLEYRGSTDSTLVFAERHGNVVSVYDKLLNSKYTIWDIKPQQEGDRIRAEAVHHRGEFYTVRLRPLADGGSRLSLMQVDPRYPNPVTELFGEDFPPLEWPEGGWHLHSAGERLFFAWPVRESLRRGEQPRYRIQSIATAATATDDRLVYPEGEDIVLNYRDPLYRSVRATPAGLILTNGRATPNDRKSLLTLYRSDREEVTSVEGAAQMGETSYSAAHLTEAGDLILEHNGTHPSYEAAYVRFYADGRTSVTEFDYPHRGQVAYGGRLVYRSAVPGRPDDYYIFSDALDGEPSADTLGIAADYGNNFSGGYGDAVLLAGARLYYPSVAGDYLRYFDLRTGANGRLILDNDFLVLPETFRSIVQVGDLIYGTVRHQRLGREPFYLETGEKKTVAGTVYHDDNENRRRDDSEAPIEGHTVSLVSATGTRVASTDRYGRYSFLLPEEDGNLNLRVGEVASCGPSAGFAPTTYSISGSESVVDRDFGLRSTDRGSAAAAAVHFTIGNTRCNTTTRLWITVKNTGCGPLTEGYLSLELPEEMYVVPSDPARPPDPSGRYRLAIDDLRPLESKTVSVAVRLPSENFTGYALPIVTTALIGRDTLDSYEAAPILRCAYDPNDKLVQPVRQDPGDNQYAARDERLTYTIRFQNTGNDTAYTVRLEDQLSPGLDWASYRLESSSHACISSIDTSGKLRVQFAQIMLPDSTTDPVASQGYVRFSLLPQAAGPRGERIQNTAEIYFDANQPIITNTVYNTIVPYIDQDRDGYPFWLDCDDTDPATYPGAVDLVSTNEHEDCNDLSSTRSANTLVSPRYYPNPVTDRLHLEFAAAAGQRQYAVAFYTPQGQLVREATLTGRGIVAVHHLPRGAYVVRVTEVTTGATTSFWIAKQ